MPAAAILLTAFAGVFGLVIGSFLNVVAYRVPAGISLLRESRCPQCDAPIRAHQNIPVVSWAVQGGRCASCGAGISGRYPLIELVTGALFTAVAVGTLRQAQGSTWASQGATWASQGSTSAAQGSIGWSTNPWFWGELVMLVLFAALSVVLTAIDVDVKRLPNAIVLPGWVATIVILGLTTIAGIAGGIDPSTGSGIAGGGSGIENGGGSGVAAEPFIRALLGGVALFLFYFVIRLISPRGMGGGDVKLAGLVGTVLGWFGWGALVVGAFAAFVLGGAVGIALILLRRAKRKSAIPFGPWMLAGAWLGILFGEPIARWYLGIYT